MQRFFEKTNKIGNIEQIGKEIIDLFKILSDKNVKQLIKNPIVSTSKKIYILNQLISLSKDTKQFIDFVGSKKRIAFISEIADKFIQMDDQSKKITKGILTSAIALDAQQVKTITNKLNDKLGLTCILECKVNSSIQGGFIIKMQDKVLDYSLKSRIDDLKLRLMAKA